MRVSIFCPPPPLSEVSPSALVTVACASGVIGTLLLLVLLAPPPGASGWWVLLPHLGSPDLQAPRGGWGAVGVASASISGIVRFVGFNTAGREQGAGVVDGSVAGGTGSRLSVATGTTTFRRLESYVLLPLLLLGSLGLQASLPQPGDHDCRDCLHCFPSSTSSMCSRPSTFRCTDMWSSLAF